VHYTDLISGKLETVYVCHDTVCLAIELRKEAGSKFVGEQCYQRQRLGGTMLVELPYASARYTFSRDELETLLPVLELAHIFSGCSSPSFDFFITEDWWGNTREAIAIRYTTEYSILLEKVGRNRVAVSGRTSAPARVYKLKEVSHYLRCDVERMRERFRKTADNVFESDHSGQLPGWSWILIVARVARLVGHLNDTTIRRLRRVTVRRWNNEADMRGVLYKFYGQNQERKDGTFEIGSSFSLVAARSDAGDEIYTLSDRMGKITVEAKSLPQFLARLEAYPVLWKSLAFL
jgi:hypothetical protein